jgi:uncharacterized protein (DUF58 family)
MRATARADLLLVLAAALALASLPARSVLPALGAALLLGLLAAARSSLGHAEVAVKTRLPPRAFAGKPFLLRLEATVQPSLPCEVHAAAPEGARLRALDALRGRGHASWEAALEPAAPGTLRLGEVVVRIAEPLGLWVREVRPRLEGAIHVLPESAFARAGGRLGSFEAMARGRRAFQETVEVERIRPYQPGDRLRDVDWAHSSKLGALLTRERTREAPRPLVLLVDATRIHRWNRHLPMLASTSRAVMALAGAARTSGVPVGAVVYGDEGVLQVVRAVRGHGEVERLAHALSRLPEGIAVAGPPAHGAPEGAPAGPERRFLAAVAPFVQGPLPAAAPLEAAIAAVAKVAGHPSLVVHLTSVDHAPSVAATAARRLRRHGHHVAVVSPSLPAHLLAPGEAETHAAWVEAVLARREEAAQRLARLGVPLVVVRPGDEVRSAEEVVAWAR